MNMRSRCTVIGVVLLGVYPLTVWSLPWDKDMVDQPSIKAQESEVVTNSSSVPTEGNEDYPSPQSTIELVRARLDAGKVLQNPIPRSAASVERGRLVFETHCAVCHGDGGEGNGPVGTKFIPQPMNLTLDYVQLQPDGQIYYTISHGSIAMPFYRQAIPLQGRWDLVNYIKAVFLPE